MQVEFCREICYDSSMTEAEFRTRYAEQIRLWGEPRISIDYNVFSAPTKNWVFRPTHNRFIACFYDSEDCRFCVDITHFSHNIIETHLLRYQFVHRDNGPARIIYDSTYRLVEENYFDQNQMHKEDGPARIRYSKRGIAVEDYFWRGVQVTKDVIFTPKEQKLQDILGEESIEAKRVRIERFGWPEFLELVKPKVLDEGTDEISGTHQTLLSVKMPDEQRILLCSCPSTARVYPIELPRRIKTCEKAQIWLRGDTLKKVRLIGAS